MRFTRRTKVPRFLDVEITPMIDVVFLLIIFFMTTAQFARITREEMDLPQEEGEQEPDPEEAGFVINLTADGRIIVASEEVDLDLLQAMILDEMSLRESRPERFRLMLRADRNADTASLNRVIGLLRELGVGAAAVATEVPR